VADEIDRPETDPGTDSGTEPEIHPATCSARGCRAAAVHELRWNNPRLHTPDRRKVWLACEEHRQSLSDFLAARQFLREVAPH
jgi:hypothetical protein